MQALQKFVKIVLPFFPQFAFSVALLLYFRHYSVFKVQLRRSSSRTPLSLASAYTRTLARFVAPPLQHEPASLGFALGLDGRTQAGVSFEGEILSFEC